MKREEISRDDDEEEKKNRNKELQKKKKKHTWTLFEGLDLQMRVDRRKSGRGDSFQMVCRGDGSFLCRMAEAEKTCRRWKLFLHSGDWDFSMKDLY